MSFELDYYWSFRSPYSYLSTARVVDIHKTYEVEVNVRPVYPLAMRVKDFFRPENMPRLRYILLDCHREAEYRGIPMVWPDPDPIVQDLETMQIAEDQPHMRRLMPLGVMAARAGKGLSFIHAVSDLIWNGKVRGWNLGDHLARATENAGLDLEELERLAKGEEDSIEAEIEANHKALTAAGHWGVPTLVYDNQPFFGQDRIETCLWAMKQAGLKKR